MNKTNRFIATISLTCVVIDIGLFLFACVSEQTQIQFLTLFNIACFSLYYLLTGRK